MGSKGLQFPAYISNPISQAERVISFVPPDGSFRLLSFNITNQGCVLYCVLTIDTLDWTWHALVMLLTVFIINSSFIHYQG